MTDRVLELLGYSNIGDFLDLQPGVSVTRDGPGKAAAVRIRGEEGFRTRIILDGIDIADPSSPQVSPRIEHLLSEVYSVSRCSGVPRAWLLALMPAG